jgi:galactokinase
LTARAFRAPGRVNLIGEHTDYNLGFVLPIALDLSTVAIATPSRDGRLHVHTALRNQQISWSPAELADLSPAHDWSDYVVGVARELTRAGFPLEPLEIRIESTVPEGAGLSSSAALEVSCALAMLNGRLIDRLQLARICQAAERDFAGVPNGIMDQYASVFGQDGAALEIDCRSLTHKVVSLPPNVEILAVNSMVKHALGHSAYRQRTEQCAAAVEAIRVRYPEARSLRDVNAAMLTAIWPDLPGIPARRARHVVGENRRVGEFVASSGRGDLRRMGELFADSHASLRDDYEVSCEELDFLVETAGSIEGVWGARMTGGGFGGCIVAMVDPAAADRFRAGITSDSRCTLKSIAAGHPPAHLKSSEDRSPADETSQLRDIEFFHQSKAE